MLDYVVLFAVVFGVNLLPALGPPTWSILVFYGLRSNGPVVPAVFTAALAAATGRFLLASGFRRLRSHLPSRTIQNLAAAKDALERRKRSYLIGLGLFAVSPLPSAQLFEAAGLTELPLAGFTFTFFIGRVISYALYISMAHTLRASSLGEAFADTLSNPLAIAIQALMIAALVALTQIDWRKRRR